MRPYLLLLTILLAPMTARAQFSIPEPTVPACAGDLICQAKYDLFDGYLKQMGLLVLMHELPDLYKDVLAPHYPGADLSNVRFGVSNRQPAGNTTADCEKIYFSNATYVENVRTGLLTDNITLLLHELRHFEQCGDVGGRDYFARMWWDNLSAVELQGFLVNGDWIALHDQMAMEGDADARASNVLSALIECCLHPSNGALIRPLQVSSFTIGPSVPAVGEQVTFAVDASHGAAPLTYEWHTKNPSSSYFLPLSSTGNSGSFLPHEGGNWELRLNVKQNSGDSQSLTNDYTETRTIYVDPKLPFVSGLTLNKSSVEGGESLQGTVQVNQLPAVGPVQVNLSSSAPGVTLPAVISVSNGASGMGSATFDIATGLSPATRTVKIEARVGESVMAASFQLKGISLVTEMSHDSFNAKEVFEMRLMLDRPPPVAITIRLESSHPDAISVPREVTFARGEQRKTITLRTADRLERTTSVTISGRIGDDRTRAIESRVEVRAAAPASPTRRQ